MDHDALRTYRNFLKDSIRKKISFRQTDQNQQIPPPPIQNPCPADAHRIDLAGPKEWKDITKTDITQAIGNRKSHRKYLDKVISKEELSYLLWSTQGLRESPTHGHAYRTVPSAGCRHAFETYLAVFNVEGLDPGVYRYLPLQSPLSGWPFPTEWNGAMVLLPIR